MPPPAPREWVGLSRWAQQQCPCLSHSPCTSLLCLQLHAQSAHRRAILLGTSMCRRLHSPVETCDQLKAQLGDTDICSSASTGPPVGTASALGATGAAALPLQPPVAPSPPASRCSTFPLPSPLLVSCETWFGALSPSRSPSGQATFQFPKCDLCMERTGKYHPSAGSTGACLFNFLNQTGDMYNSRVRFGLKQCKRFG